MSDTRDIKTTYSDLFREYSGSWDAFFEEAMLDLEMHFGAEFTQEQIEAAREIGRTLYPFNKTARQVELIHGYEIRNRHVLKIGPTDRDDDLAAHQHTGLIMQDMVAADGYDILSSAFKWGSLVTGSNLFEIANDRKGNRKFYRRPHNSFLLDPAFSNPDLSDCRNILSGRWLHENEIKRLLPTEAEKIDKIPSSQHSRWRDAPNISRAKYMRLMEEWWSLEDEFPARVFNRATGEDLLFDEFKVKVSNSAKAANDLIKELRTADGMPILTKYHEHRQVVKLRVFVDSEVVWDGPNPTGLDEYNFVWLGGEYCPELPREELKLRSFTRKLRCPQYARDKRLNQAIDILETAIMSGKLVKEGALANEEDAYRSGQGQVLIVKSGFEGELRQAVEELRGQDIPPGVFNLIEALDKEETQAGGMNEEIFGNDDKDIPGILHKYRTGQALTGQQSIFQGFRRAKRQVGIKLVKMNQIWANAQVIQRRLNQMPAQGFYDPDFTRLDCVPTEGLLTDSQRSMFYEELKQLNALFPGQIPLSQMLRFAPIQYPKEFLQMIEQNEQEQSKLAQATLRTKEAMDNMLLAESQLNMAKAHGEMVDAGYDRAKTMVEMQKIAAEPRLGVIDRYLQYLTLQQQKEQMQLDAKMQAMQAAKQTAKKAG